MGMKERLIKICFVMFIMISILFSSNIKSNAEESRVTITGSSCINAGKGNYTISAEDIVQKPDDNSGSLILDGSLTKVSSDDSSIDEYAVSNGQAVFSYSYPNSLMESEGKSIYKENSKKIAGIKLNKKIGKGALLLQTSKDGEKWLTEYVKSDLLSQVPTDIEAFYSSTDIQLMSGCYYRVIVAYTIQQFEDTSKILFINKNNYSYTSYTEVYEFYLYNADIKTGDDAHASKQSLGTKTKTEKNGYTGVKEIDDDDCHYGWDLGNFFVSGYTSTISSTDNVPIFLKNQGDKVSLWFELLQDIDHLNGKDSLSIAEDENGYDQYFEIPETNFGRGTLIIRYTDYENIKHTPEVYTNYLESNAVTGKSQRIQILDEGDYEIALDYEIKNDKTKMLAVIPNPSYSDYRIYFKFSVRNADSNVILTDLENNSKLRNSAFTESGFSVELETTRYLDVDVKHEIYNAKKRTFTENKKLKRIAKSGGEYTEEGIYLIHAKNRYTDSETTKMVYVGNDPYLQECVEKGMTWDEILKNLKEVETVEQETTLAETTKDNQENATGSADTLQKDSNVIMQNNNMVKVLIAVAILVVIVLLITVISVKSAKKEKKEGEDK